MQRNPTRDCNPDSARLHFPARVVLRRPFAILLDGLERARQRRALASLSDTMLKDIGLSRRDVERECRRSFWR
jgi:uncharacterized protein YjiS (DUF1127 family)